MCYNACYDTVIRGSGRKTLFGAADYDASQPHANYDISPDGRHFVMVRRSPASTIGVIQNLPELVNRMQRRGVAR